MVRAGDSIEDFCRACKLDRMHTVIAADQAGAPIRVACGYCSSEHNYRGGPRMEASVGREAATVAARTSASITTSASTTTSTTSPSAASRTDREAFPIVSDRERIAPPMSVTSESHDLEMLLRRILREEAGVTAVAPADRWRGGTLVLRPGNGSQEKTWPVETFFHKIVMIRNRLRTLEQQVNALEMPPDVKIKCQSYISGCYGSLTSFNLLFADEADQFKGSGGD